MDEMTGQPGTIDEVAAQVRPRGKIKGTARRSMTMAAALRAVLLMGLMPDAGYGEILAALFGDLPLVPWHVPFAVPTETVLATWRDAAGPEPVLRLQDMALAASDAEHQVIVSPAERTPIWCAGYVLAGALLVLARQYPHI